MAALAPIIKGISTLLWGTAGSMDKPSGTNAAIIESLAITPKNASPVAEIEDNNGAGVAVVLLVDGFNAKATLTYDKGIAWPAEGDTVTLTLPVTGASGGTSAYKCVLVSYAPTLTRKKEATIEMELLYRPGIVVT